MAKKNDKASKAAKRQRGLQKQKKNLKKSERSSAKSNAKYADDEDIDLDAMLAEMAQKQADFEKVDIVQCQRPTKRQNATLVASPDSNRELFLFGGESLTPEGSAQFFNDLYVYNLHLNIWKLAKSANQPLPRSSHATCSHPSGVVVMHGGEFSSPKQTTFHHYGDTWVLDANTKEWTKIECDFSPQPRSGHRMCVYKNYVLLFGGFRDLSMSTSYLDDLWAFNINTFVWTKLEFPKTMSQPEPRSGHSLLPTPNGALMFGGYTKVKAAKNMQKGKVLQDYWILNMNADLEGCSWERRKRGSYAPSPRIGYQLVPHRLGTSRGVMFGGVFDTDETEENLKSLFFNQFYSYQADTNRWHELKLRQRKQPQKQQSTTVSRDADLERNLNEILKGLNLDVDEMLKPDEELGVEDDDKPLEFELRMNLPHKRFNSAVCVQQDQMFIYCGQFEDGDKEFIIDSFYSVDLSKLDGLRVIWEEIVEENNEGSDDDDDGDEDESDDGESDTEVTESDKPLVVEEPDPSAVDEIEEESEDEEEEDKDPRPWLPQPQPFESVSNFYKKHLEKFVEFALNDEPDARGKHLKKFAFELAQSRWWERRASNQKAEDEFEEMGVHELVERTEKRTRR